MAIEFDMLGLEVFIILLWNILKSGQQFWIVGSGITREVATYQEGSSDIYRGVPSYLWLITDTYMHNKN